MIFTSERLENALRLLHIAADGVIESVVVNNDGLLVASFPPGDEENPLSNPTSSPQVAAISSTLIGIAENTLRRLQQGTLQRLMIDSQKGIILIYPAGRAFLVILNEKDADLTQVLFAARLAAKEVRKILDTH